MYKYFYREAEREEEEEDKVQIQKKDKQRERERVTQLGVRGDNGIITLNYNNIPPPPRTLLQIQSGLHSFRKMLL